MEESKSLKRELEGERRGAEIKRRRIKQKWALRGGERSENGKSKDGIGSRCLVMFSRTSILWRKGRVVETFAFFAVCSCCVVV